MQKKKRNHWVPRSYLRAFAADETRKKVWLFSKNAGDPECKGIDKVAVRFYLYAPNDRSGKRDYSFEDKLASLEMLFGHQLWAQLCNDYVDLTHDPLRKMVALLAAVMWLRNPKFLHFTKELHRQIVAFNSQFESPPEEVEIAGRVLKMDVSKWPEYCDADDDAIKRMWLDHVGSAAWLAEIMLKMRWGVLFSESPAFITTDNPVITMNSGLKFEGLRNPETTLLFPLSPTRILFMDNRLTEPDGRYYPAFDPPSINCMLWRESIEFMFSSRHPDQVCWEMDASARNMGF